MPTNVGDNAYEAKIQLIQDASFEEESISDFKGPASDHWPILGRPHL
jgi:hypothetical protein